MEEEINWVEVLDKAYEFEQMLKEKKMEEKKMNNIAKDIKYLFDNSKEMNLSKEDISALKESVKYIKAYALQKIIERNIDNKPGLERQIEWELKRYEKELKKVQEQLNQKENEKAQIAKKLSFSFKKYQTYKSHKGLGGVLQNIVEKKKKQKYEEEKEQAKKEYEKNLDKYKEDFSKVEEEINKYKKMIANLTVLKEKVKAQDLKQVIQTAKLAYNITNTEFNKIVNMCASSLTYENGDIESIKIATQGNKPLFEKISTKDGVEYLPNKEAIFELSNFVEENSSELKELQEVIQKDKEIENTRETLKEITKKINDRTTLINELKNNPKEHIDYSQDVLEKTKRVEELEEQIHNSKLPEKKKNILFRMFSRLFKKESKVSNENLENKLVIAKAELEEAKRKETEEEEIKENERRVIAEKEEMHNDYNTKLKVLENMINERNEMLKGKSSKAQQVYEKYGYSNNEWDVFGMKGKDTNQNDLKGIYDRHVVGKNTKSGEVKPLVALKIMQLVLDAQKIERPEDARRLGIAITKEEIAKCSKMADELANYTILKFSKKVKKDIKEAENVNEDSNEHIQADEVR